MRVTVQVAVRAAAKVAVKTAALRDPWCLRRVVVGVVAGVGVFAAGTAPAQNVALFPSASDPSRQGFVRIINHANRPGEIEISAIDDDGNRRGPLTLPIDARAALHLNSNDVENGNASKGLNTGTGPGNGDWRLELASDLDIEVLAYVRTADGFLTAMHDTVARGDDGRYRIAFFNPGDNDRQTSSLRLVNAGDDAVQATIRGVDDKGTTPAEGVEIEIPAGTARTFTASELETGATAFDGALGDGSGKWRLTVDADGPLTVVNLLASPTGELANLSAMTEGADDAGRHSVPLFPAAADPADLQGFVRVINRSDVAGSIGIDSNRDHDRVTLAIGANEALHFNSDDWELGNAQKGLPGVGAADGDWQLSLTSDLDIDVLAYVRNKRDGFVTAMHDHVPAVALRHRVAVFNPGSNRAQTSLLRLANRGTSPARVSITGVDDRGVSPGGGVVLTVAAGQVRTLAAPDLETGGGDFDGKLGDGNGKWRLVVESDAPLHVMSLLASPGGHLTNLSRAPGGTAPTGASAFDDRALGKRIVPADAERYLEFVSAGRYQETRDGETTSGSYEYANAGASEGTLTLEADAGVSCTIDLVFASRDSGRVSWCDEPDADPAWRLLQPTRTDGDRVTYEVTAEVETLPPDFSTPDVLRGATASTVGGSARLAFDNGGYVELGAYRYTCRDVAGCVIEDHVVIQGRVVQTPAMAILDFDLVPANASPAGIAHGNGVFYVVDTADRRVYTYETSGERLPGRDFDLVAGTRTPAGITLDASRFYVVDELLDDVQGLLRRNVYVYDAQGQHLPAADFELAWDIREPLGIAYFDARLYIADAWTDKVYAYRTSGERTPEDDFDLAADNGSPRGIVHGNGGFYVADIFDDKAYAYATNGERDPGKDFDFVDGNSLVRGIALVDGSFYVADADRVYAYPADRPDLVVSAFSVEDPQPDAGRPFTLNATVRNVGHRRSATATTLRYHRTHDWTTRVYEVGRNAMDGLGVDETVAAALALDAPSRAGFADYYACVDGLPEESRLKNCSDAIEVTVPVDIDGASVGFALDADNRRPTGIVYANDRFHVLDAQDDRVYAYRTTAARDAGFDFALDAANDRPVAVAHAEGGFYVVDFADDKVYAYDASGARNADADFALAAENSSPWAIAFGNDRFFVANRSGGTVYAYEASGQRDADADIRLDDANDTPWGMAFADGLLYVVDLFDGHVYAYAASGARESALEFDLRLDNAAPEGLAFVGGRFYVTDSTDDTVYGYAAPQSPDLAVEDLAASDSAPGAGGAFTLTGNVRNLGQGHAAPSTLRYYLSASPPFETPQALVGTDTVGALEPAGSVEWSVDMTVAENDGCYFAAACVDAVPGERVTANNCPVPAEVLVGDAPDLDFSRISMDYGEVGDPVELVVGVINRGTGSAQAGKLRVTGGDAVEVDIPTLEPDEEEILERQTIGTGQAGTTTYEICIDVPCEGNPDDNCRTRSVSL